MAPLQRRPVDVTGPGPAPHSIQLDLSFMEPAVVRLLDDETCPSQFTGRGIAVDAGSRQAPIITHGLALPSWRRDRNPHEHRLG
jgi:hypothetical protein